jgi:hypothetical protein
MASRYLILAGFTIAAPAPQADGSMVEVLNRGDIVTLDADTAAVETHRNRVVEVTDNDDPRIVAVRDAVRAEIGAETAFRSDP